MRTSSSGPRGKLPPYSSEQCSTLQRAKKARPRALSADCRVRTKAMGLETTAVSVVPLSSGQSFVPRSQNTARFIRYLDIHI